MTKEGAHEEYKERLNMLVGAVALNPSLNTTNTTGLLTNRTMFSEMSRNGVSKDTSPAPGQSNSI